MEKALLVAAKLQNMQYDLEYSLEELKNLAEACDIEVVDKTYQNLNSINTKYYIGSGKVEEIKDYIVNNDITVVIFNDELSPAQLSNLEDALDIKVIDRTLLVLDIFRKRATTQEAILEVKLAQLRYMLPRLVGLHASLSRQGGGTGGFSAKGPGETQIELDRRKIIGEILQLESKLEKVKANRETQRARRKKTNLPIVSLVGYTNAGKSSTMNKMLEYCKIADNKAVFEKDMLFATLNTSARNIKLPNNLEFLLLDTVGFVSNLPHHLVNSFRSTLEEIKESDLIIHVIDISDSNWQTEMQITNEMLESLECNGIPKIYLLNKADKIENRSIYLENSILYSNKTLENQELLFEKITENLLEKTADLYEVKIPFTDGASLALINGHGIIKAKIQISDFMYYKVYLTPMIAAKIKQYLI